MSQSHVSPNIKQNCPGFCSSQTWESRSTKHTHDTPWINLLPAELCPPSSTCTRVLHDQKVCARWWSWEGPQLWRQGRCEYMKAGLLFFWGSDKRLTCHLPFRGSSRLGSWIAGRLSELPVASLTHTPSHWKARSAWIRTQAPSSPESFALTTDPGSPLAGAPAAQHPTALCSPSSPSVCQQTTSFIKYTPNSLLYLFLYMCGTLKKKEVINNFSILSFFMAFLILDIKIRTRSDNYLLPVISFTIW